MCLQNDEFSVSWKKKSISTFQARQGMFHGQGGLIVRNGAFVAGVSHMDTPAATLQEPCLFLPNY